MNCEGFPVFATKVFPVPLCKLEIYHFSTIATLNNPGFSVKTGKYSTVYLLVLSKGNDANAKSFSSRTSKWHNIFTFNWIKTMKKQKANFIQTFCVLFLFLFFSLSIFPAFFSDLLLNLFCSECHYFCNTWEYGKRKSHLF